MRAIFPTLVLALGLLAPPLPRPAAAAPVNDEESRLVDALWRRMKDAPAGRRPRVALVLGGGGARGLAHIGVLKVLEREGVPVDIVVGTSVGALVGALYAAGIPVADIERMGRDIGWDQLTDLSTARLVKLLVTEEMLSTQRMEDYLKGRIGDKQFADLEKAFACVAADLKTGEQIVLKEGSVALAARASATMPGLFRPVPYRHRFLVDGGIVNNIPTDVAQWMGADIILCVAAPADFALYNVSNVVTTLTQALYIQGEVIGQERLAKADVVVRPAVGDVTAMQLWRSKECIEAGAAAARSSLPDIRRVLAKKFFERLVAGEK
ncbi:MAG: patatin-like phospholipase family protein [Elusimicrobiota bacterium]